VEENEPSAYSRGAGCFSINKNFLVGKMREMAAMIYLKLFLKAFGMWRVLEIFMGKM